MLHATTPRPFPKVSLCCPDQPRVLDRLTQLPRVTGYRCALMHLAFRLDQDLNLGLPCGPSTWRREWPEYVSVKAPLCLPTLCLGAPHSAGGAQALWVLLSRSEEALSASWQEHSVVNEPCAAPAGGLVSEQEMTGRRVGCSRRWERAETGEIREVGWVRLGQVKCGVRRGP